MSSSVVGAVTLDRSQSASQIEEDLAFRHVKRDARLGSTWTSPLRWSICFGSNPMDRSGFTATSLPNASMTLFAVGVSVLSVRQLRRPAPDERIQDRTCGQEKETGREEDARHHFHHALPVTFFGAFLLVDPGLRDEIA